MINLFTLLTHPVLMTCSLLTSPTNCGGSEVHNIDNRLSCLKYLVITPLTKQIYRSCRHKMQFTKKLIKFKLDIDSQ